MNESHVFFLFFYEKYENVKTFSINDIICLSTKIPGKNEQLSFSWTCCKKRKIRFKNSICQSVVTHQIAKIESDFLRMTFYLVYCLICNILKAIDQKLLFSAKRCFETASHWSYVVKTVFQCSNNSSGYIASLPQIPFEKKFPNVGVVLINSQ